MSIIHLHYNPPKLGISTNVSIILPFGRTGAENLPGSFEAYAAANPVKFPVLWLLHGGGGYHMDFLYGSPILTLAERYGIAVVMPDGQQSCWVDMVYGPNWETWLAEGLPEYLYQNFPLSDRREDNFIAGVSMGGYSAIHTALHYPDRYAAACGMGPGVWMPEQYASGDSKSQHSSSFDTQLENCFGSDRSKVMGSQYDCLQCAKDALAAGKTLPRLLCQCGTTDFSYRQNVAFRDKILALGVNYEWYETEDGHSMEAWNEFMPTMLDWMLDKEPKQYTYINKE